MNLIAAADRRWGIGRDGDLLFRIPADMRYFAGKTTGQIIVVGRKTLESFPGGKPLPRRTNIVLSRDASFDGKGAEVVHGRDELFDRLQQDAGREVWVAGGGSIYRMLLPWCRYAYITRVDEICDADTFMPDLDKEPGWILRDPGEPMQDGGISFRFSIYENQRVVNGG